MGWETPAQGHETIAADGKRATETPKNKCNQAETVLSKYIYICFTNTPNTSDVLVCPKIGCIPSSYGRIFWGPMPHFRTGIKDLRGRPPIIWNSFSSPFLVPMSSPCWFQDFAYESVHFEDQPHQHILGQPTILLVIHRL